MASLIRIAVAEETDHMATRVLPIIEISEEAFKITKRHESSSFNIETAERSKQTFPLMELVIAELICSLFLI